MRAVLVSHFGGPEVLTVRVVPDPAPGPEEVLVQVRAIGVNPVDTYIRSGQYATVPELPYIPGTDAAGDVAAVSAEVTRVKPGDRVYLAGQAAYAEQVVVPALKVCKLPDTVSYAEGAAIGIPYATAYRALFLVGRASPEGWVLVHGASGAVGLAALQWGRLRGLRMVGTASTDRGRQLIEAEGFPALGHHDWEEAMRLTGGEGFDLIAEMAAHLSLGDDLPTLKRGGRVAVVGSRGPVTINPRDLMGREASIVGVMNGWSTPDERAQIDREMAEGLARGILKPVVGRTFPLTEAAEAHRAVLEPGAYGKIVLIP